MTAEFAWLLAMSGFGVVAAAPMLIVPLLLAPKKPNPIKQMSFECGQVPVGEGRMHFMMQYYAYLIMFVIFDVMSIFLFAWAVSPTVIAATAPVVVAFLGILLVPMAYALTLAGRRQIW